MLKLFFLPALLQSWFFSLIPECLWTRAWSVYNRKSRKNHLEMALEQQNPQLFQRLKVYGSAAIPPAAGSLAPPVSPLSSKETHPKPTRTFSSPSSVDCPRSKGNGATGKHSNNEQESSSTETLSQQALDQRYY